MPELIAWIKANADKASVGVASTTQLLVAAYFESMTGTHLLIVPYRGSAPALQDMIAGNSLRPAVEFAAAASRRQHEGFWRHFEETARRFTGRSIIG